MMADDAAVRAAIRRENPFADAGRLLNAIRRNDAACTAALDKVRERYAEKRNAILGAYSPEVRELVLAELERMLAEMDAK